MEFVCHDNGPSEWFYNKDDDTYRRSYPDRQDYALCYGKFLPDPKFLWESRIKAHMGKTDPEKLKPSPATYALWEHRQKLLGVIS